MESVLGEVGRPVALKQCYAGVIGAYDVADLRYVTFVFPVGAVFVLYLYHDDGTSVLYGHVGYLLGNGFFKDAYTFYEVRVGFAQAYVLLLEQPPGQSAHFPFGTDIGPWAQDDIHIVLLAQAAEFCQVILPGEVEYTRLRLMRVPEDVEADCVHAQCFAHFDALVPIGLGDAWIVQFCGFETNGLPFNRNVPLPAEKSPCPSHWVRGSQLSRQGIVIVPSLPNSSGSHT